MGYIHFENIHKDFGQNKVLKGITMDIEKGHLVTLLGPSGCGKSTLLRCLSGLEDVTSGQITMDGKDITHISPRDRGIGMVFQQYSLFPNMSVAQNVAFGLNMKKVPKDTIRRKVSEILTIVGLEDKAEQYPNQLSGGQQQRVALGRALVAEPKLLLLDEPLSNLDAKLRESMRFEIKEIQKNFGISVVYVTHDQSEAMAMSDRVIVINRGVIQQIGTPIEIYRNPANQFVADFLGKINFIKGEVKSGRIELTGLGQSLAYDGPRTGKVVVAVRPENIDLSLDSGDLEGRISSMFYMGDVNDCRVDINGVQVRVIADSHSYDKLYGNEKIFLRIKEFLVYEDDGNDEHTKIVT